MAIEIVFETHSTTEDNEAGRATGWLPGRLSEQGRARARELGRRRARDGIAAVFLADLPARWDGRRVVIIGHVATRWALDHALRGVPVEELMAEDFGWRPGWSYVLDT